MLASVPRNHPNQTRRRGVDDATDDRETPPCVYVPLDAEFRFTLDAASNHHNAKCPLYATLTGLYANIAGRIVPVYEEDETGGNLPGVDWDQAPEGLWVRSPVAPAQEAQLAGAPSHLRLGGRRYTAWDDGLPQVRQPQLCEPPPPVLGDPLGQYEGLFPQGETGWAFYARPPANDTLAGEARGRRTGLDISWRGHRVFANPPFSWLRPWVEKAWDEDATAVMVLPNNRSEQPFWQRYIEPYRDKPGSLLTTRNLPKRRPFLHRGKVIGNRTSKNPPFGLTLAVWDRRRPC